MSCQDKGNVAHLSADLVVVGGGIHGCVLHLLAARAGLRTILIEKGDFGAEASWSTSRVLHGGIRYLQSGDLRRIRASVLARNWFYRSFPDLTSPLPCLMPLYGVGVRRRSAMRVALHLQDLLSWDRNDGVPRTHFLPRGRILSPGETREEFPLVAAEGLQGAAMWFDGLVRNPSRLLMELLNWAKACGGVAFNYKEARGVACEKNRLAGVVVMDIQSGIESMIRTSRVAFCTGSFEFLPQDPVSWGQGLDDVREFSFNLLLDKKLPSNAAVAVDSGRGHGQLFFLVPLGSVTIAGTSHQPIRGKAPPDPSREQVDGMVRQLSLALPRWGLVPEDICRVLAGVVPRKELVDRIDDHTNSSLPPGCVRVRSAKYTTAPATGGKALQRLFGTQVLRSGGTPRPPATEVLSPQEFLTLHESDPWAARKWVEGIWRGERVRGVEDFVLRRMDWGIHPDLLPTIRELLEEMTIYCPWMRPLQAGSSG